MVRWLQDTADGHKCRKVMWFEICIMRCKADKIFWVQCDHSCPHWHSWKTTSGLTYELCSSWKHAFDIRWQWFCKVRFKQAFSQVYVRYCAASLGTARVLHKIIKYFLLFHIQVLHASVTWYWKQGWHKIGFLPLNYMEQPCLGTLLLRHIW